MFTVRRAALKLTLGCVVAGGLVLIGRILTSSFNELALRVALALIAIWVFGLTGLRGVEASAADAPLARPTGVIAQVTAATALLISLGLIGLWDRSPDLGEWFGRFCVVLLTVALTSGHGAYLLARTRSDDTAWTRRTVYVACAVLVLLAGLICAVAVAVHGHVDDGLVQFFWRLLAVLTIVGVGATIAVPIERRLWWAAGTGTTPVR